MADFDQRWAEQLKVSGKANADSSIGKKGLWHRQQTANYIQELGNRLSLRQLSKNTAIVYSHRFYTIQPVESIKPHELAMAAILLAAKTEDDEPKYRSLKRIIQAGLTSLNLDLNDDVLFQQYKDTILKNESHLLATLGFDLAVDHPHAHVIKNCHMFKVPESFIHSAYSIATATLLLTTMCLEHSPRIVACVCIYIAMKWSNLEIPKAHDGNYWFYFVCKEAKIDLIEELASEFLSILEKLPSGHGHQLLRAVIRKETDISVWDIFRRGAVITAKSNADEEIQSDRRREVVIARKRHAEKEIQSDRAKKLKVCVTASG